MEKPSKNGVAKRNPLPLDVAAQIETMTTAELKEELANGLRVTAASLLKIALVVRELEKRGESLSALRLGVMPYLRLIAAGTLLPEIVVRFAGQPSLIQRLAKLPIAEQRPLASGDPVKILQRLCGDSYTLVSKDPIALTPTEAKQVFADNHVRQEDEQRDFIKGASKKTGPRAYSQEASSAPTDRAALEDAFAFAATASAGDLAERLADMIVKNPEAALVMAKLKIALQERLDKKSKW